MRTFLYLIFFCCLISCKEKVHNTSAKRADMFQIIFPDTTKHSVATDIDYGYYLHVNQLYKRLSLYPLINGTDSFELRLWGKEAFSTWNVLYILKGIDTNWTMIKYLFCTKAGMDENGKQYNESFSKPIITNFIHIKSLEPIDVSWHQFISSLYIDSLWALPSQSDIQDDIGICDGISIVLELADKNRYKYIHYSCPDYKKSRLMRLTDSLILHLYTKKDTIYGAF